MATEQLERRLTAILAADVAGYSRRTGLDEEGAHVQLREHLRSLVDPKIAEHRGRIVKNTDDGLLAEFGSVVDAVRCAIDVQRGVAGRNVKVPRDRRIEFRASNPAKISIVLATAMHTRRPVRPAADMGRIVKPTRWVWARQ